MTIIEIAERLVNGLREDEATRPYRLLRDEITTFADAVAWLLDWHGPDGSHTWKLGGSGAGRVDRAARHWLFLRWRFRRECTERGMP